MGILKIPRITTTDRGTITPDQGELLYDTTNGKLYKGNGSTVGGVEIAGGKGVEYITTGGSATAYTASVLGVTSYTAGDSYLVNFHISNTGSAPTINITGSGPKTIVKNAGDTVVAGDILIDKIYLITYDGTEFQLVTIGGGSSISYPSNGIVSSTGTAWGTSYTTTGSGTVLALATSPEFATSVIGSASMDVFNTTSTTVNFAGAATALHIAANSPTAIVNIGGGTNPAELRIKGASGTYYTGFKPGTQAANITYTLPTAVAAVTGYVLSSTIGGVLSWVTPGTATTLPISGLRAATIANTFDNGLFVQEWQWNTLAAGVGLKLSSTSISATLSGQTLFSVDLSGANTTTTQTTHAAKISNTHTGTLSTNYALAVTANGAATANYGLSIVTSGTATTNYGISVSATGGTTNYAIDAAGIVRIAGGAASVPQLILTPSSGVNPSGTLDGSIWYDTTANNSTIQLRKLWTTGTSVLTKVITASYNPDFATGTASGVIVASLEGTLTKSADLTALGVYSAYASLGPLTTIAANSMISTSIVGSTTLPANFFALGKTIKVTITGVVSIAGASSTFSIWVGANIASFVISSLPNVTSRPFVMELNLVCTTAGAASYLMISGMFTIDTNSAQNAHVYIFTPTLSTTPFNSASSLVFDLKNQWINSSDLMTVNSNMCYYLN